MSRNLTSWRKDLTEALLGNGESWDDVVFNTMTEQEMDVEFDAGYGTVEGIPFTVWTKNYVYFPTGYDGSEGVASVNRDPENTPTRHI